MQATTLIPRDRESNALAKAPVNSAIPAADRGILAGNKPFRGR